MASSCAKILNVSLVDRNALHRISQANANPPSSRTTTFTNFIFPISYPTLLRHVPTTSIVQKLALDQEHALSLLKARIASLQSDITNATRDKAELDSKEKALKGECEQKVGNPPRFPAVRPPRLLSSLFESSALGHDPSGDSGVQQVWTSVDGSG